MNKLSTKKLVGTSLLIAVVVVLQLLGSFIKFGPFSISLVLVPIVVGSALYGPSVGAILGFVFGGTVIASGDAAPFMAFSPVGTVAVVLLKGTLAGYFAGLVYKVLENKNSKLDEIAAAIVAPVTNTGVFLLGCATVFKPLITEWAAAFGYGSNVVGYMFIGLVGFNFVFELVFNIALVNVIVRLIKAGRKEY